LRCVWLRKPDLSHREAVVPIQNKKAAQPRRDFTVHYQFDSVVVLLPHQRHIRATAVRHFRRHADALAQRGVGVDGLADAYRKRSIDCVYRS